MTQLGAKNTLGTNPLLENAVSDLDQPGLVDLENLHKEARQVLLRGHKQIGRGFSQLLALVGDPGAGKSHLLWWFRRQLRPESLFVALPALPDLAQPFRFTLRHFLSNLCKGQNGSQKIGRPIDRLLWDVVFSQTYDLLDAARVGYYQGPTAVLKQLAGICLENGLRRPLADFAGLAEKEWSHIEPGLRSYLLTLPTENSLDATARQVILQFPYPDRRSLTTAWLAGEELSVKDREKIGAKQTINQEATARYVLSSLVRLAAMRRPQSVVLVCDQVDQTLEQLGRPGLHALAEVLASLHGLSAATLVVLSCRPETFGQFSEKQARPGPSVLKQSMELISLAGVAPADLRELVCKRLQTTEKPPNAPEFHPLTEADLALLSQVDTPRAALARLAPICTERLDSKNTTSKKPPSIGRPAVSIARPEARAKPGAEVLVDALADALAQAEKDGPAMGKPFSLTHIDKSGPTVQAETKSKATAAPAKAGPVKAAAAGPVKAAAAAAPVKAAVLPNKAAAPAQTAAGSNNAGQTSSGVPNQRADSGDTVRRVPDEKLLSQARETASKPVAATAKNAQRESKNLSPGPAVSTKPSATPAADAKPLVSERPKSADTPSKAWLDMAGENDVLAEAMAVARAELDARPPGAAPKPIRAKVELPKGAKPLPATDFEPTRQFEVPPGELLDQTLAGPADSAISPSVSWLAMAENPLEFAPPTKDPAQETAKAPRRRQSTSALGVAVPPVKKS